MQIVLEYDKMYFSGENKIKKYHKGKLGGELCGSTHNPKGDIMCKIILAHSTLLCKRKESFILKKNDDAWNLIMSVAEQQSKYKEFISAFADMIANNLNRIENTNCKVSISVGKRNNQCFQEFLHTTFKNPVVIVGFYQNYPQITIRSFDTYNGGQTTLTLDMMENIKVKKISGRTNLKYEIDFHYTPANMDYHIQIVVR